MGSIKKKFKELLHEYDMMEDEEMVEFAMEVFKLGCKHGEMKAEGFGMRDDDMFDDDDDEEEDMFRYMWSRGGFGERGNSGGGRSGGSRGGGGYGQRRGVRGSGRGRR